MISSTIGSQGEDRVLDQDRLGEVLGHAYGYYRGPEPREEIDERLHPTTVDLVRSSLTSQSEVLDIGCGDGSTLLDLAPWIGSGVGVDQDPEHVGLAVTSVQASTITNVSFEQLGFEQLTARGWDARFDLAFSERGPVGYSVGSVATALTVVKPGGMLLAEVIGDLHHQEVREVFGGRRRQPVTVLDAVSVAFERSGVDIRYAANLISRRYYPDVYEWLKFQCSIWAWSGVPLPEPDDPRLELFARRTTEADGRIATTHHVVVVGGAKLVSGSPYGAAA